MIINRKKLYTPIFCISAIVIFDLFVSSGSVMPFRFIFDVAFTLLIYTSVHLFVFLLRGKRLAESCYSFVASKSVFIIPLVVNIKVVIVASFLGIPSIGPIDQDILIQGTNGLLPLIDYAITNLVNGTLLYVLVDKETIIRIHKVPVYTLAVIALETSLAVYCFYFIGTSGLSLAISLFHVILIVLTVWLYLRKELDKFKLTMGFPEILLACLSVGYFMMAYFPKGIHSIFGDSATILGSALSITQRGSLQPYYTVSNYYSPIGGFISSSFSYITSLENILLSSTLVFFVGHLMLPFVTYHFMRKVMTRDSRVAILGTIMALFMDGLAVILLPAYTGKLTNAVINWTISPATKSLYQSSIGWLLLKPFNVLGMAAAIACCTLLCEKNKVSLLLSGALLFLSYVNPRQPFLAFLLLLFVLGIKKTDLTRLSILGLATAIFLGPILPTMVYKYSNTIIMNLCRQNFSIGFFLENVFLPLENSRDNASLMLILSFSICIVGIILLQRSINSKEDCIAYNDEFNATKISWGRIKLPLGDRRVSSAKLQSIILVGMSFVLFAYAILHAYEFLPSSLMDCLKLSLVTPLNYAILRYHVLIPFVLLGIIGSCSRKKVRNLVIFALLILFSYLGLLAKPKLYAPLIAVILALPVLESFSNSKSKVRILIVAFFVILGVVSATLYSGTEFTTATDERVVDLPQILPILLEYNSSNSVFCGSSRDYSVRRLVESMANLKLSNNPLECHMCMAEKMYTSISLTERLLKAEDRILYNGHAFIFFETFQSASVSMPNSGFEFGNDSPYEWTAKETDPYHKALWDDITMRSGNHSINLSVQEGSDTSGVRWESNKIFIEGNPLFLFVEYYIKQNLSAGSSLVQINFYNSDNERISYERIRQIGKSNWSLKEELLICPEETNYIIMSLINRGEGDVWFDDIGLWSIS